MDGGLRGFRWHAAAPPGEWINDPNALFFADGRYQLLAQHAADAPEFQRVGWGRFTSTDLMGWTWEGVVAPSDATGHAYSGSAVRDPDGRTALFFTRHDPVRRWQTQHRAILTREGIEPAGSFGPAARNMRDPFVFRAPGEAGWRALVAAPCDWTDWRASPPSRLEYWRSENLVHWEQAGSIGPWSPAGVLWEVPAVLDFGETQALILSLVDRREGVSDCSVRYWLGRFVDDGFERAPTFPMNGMPLDLGPDFYAAIPNVPDLWSSSERVVIGWASSWLTARAMTWPGRSMGGPLTMPRSISLAPDRQSLLLAPGVERSPDWTAKTPKGSFELKLREGGAELRVARSGTSIAVVRRAAGFPDFRREHPDLPPRGTAGTVRLYVDGPLVELFFEPEGRVLTAALPGGNGRPSIVLAPIGEDGGWNLAQFGASKGEPLGVASADQPGPA